MKPIMFEEIMFLKYNYSFWNEEILSATVCANHAQEFEHRLEELDGHIEFDFC